MQVVAPGQDRKPGAARPAVSDEKFHPVACATCGTDVGVVDAKEVYHFFHVFPSNA